MGQFTLIVQSIFGPEYIRNILGQCVLTVQSIFGPVCTCRVFFGSVCVLTEYIYPDGVHGSALGVEGPALVEPGVLLSRPLHHQGGTLPNQVLATLHK